jgi:hypothetical protein
MSLDPNYVRNEMKDKKGHVVDISKNIIASAII